MGESGLVAESIDSVFTNLINRLGIDDPENKIYEVSKAIAALSSSNIRQTILDAMQVLKQHLGIPLKFGPVILFARGFDESLLNFSIAKASKSTIEPLV